MLILISPAKTLDENTPFDDEPTTPKFDAEARRIARAAAKLSANQLAKLMHISPALAEMNTKRFKGFAKLPSRPAIRTFAGDVYRGFDAASADQETLAFAQEHLRILSGLYGVLRPLDAIRAYRLEMGIHWAPSTERLVDYWDRKVLNALMADLRQEGTRTILNLASKEYFAVVRPYVPSRVKVIAPEFLVRTAKGLSFQSFTAKVARGALARFVCDERIADPAALAEFDQNGWRFDKASSTTTLPRYVRDPS